MARSELSLPHFQNEEAAFAYVEAHLWPTGPVCPHCGNFNPARIKKMVGKTVRPGLRHCKEKECGKQFTVRIGTIFEDSHLPLHLWLQVIHLMNASKKGISARQIQRMLHCSMKTAWFVGHRVREAMKDTGGFASPLGGTGSVVEIDETFIGGKETNRHANKKLGRGHYFQKAPVVALVERQGKVRAFHIPVVNSENLGAILSGNVSRHTTVYSDSFRPTRLATSKYRSATVDHSAGEYVRGDVYTNTVEGFFSILKRGITGVYHGVSEAHLQRYLAEFSHRYSNREALGIDDTQRASVALKGFAGKQLTYETTRSAGRA